MDVLVYTKLQLGVLIILFYTGILYIKGCNILAKHNKGDACNKIFDAIFITAEVTVIFDGLTAYTVNKLDFIPQILNVALHWGFFVMVQLFYFLNFLYIQSLTSRFPKRTRGKILCYAPFALSIFFTTYFIPGLHFEKGIYTNYSDGKSVYVTFLFIAIYFCLAFFYFLKGTRYVAKKKKASILITLLTSAFILAVQIAFPESLLSSVAVLVMVLTYYMNLENPTEKSIEVFHNEMIESFATLVENRDGNTGGHIKRTSLYVSLIAEKLKEDGLFKELLTKDYFDNLIKAAAMHDIGKIATPDAILQKPGKLTEEEYRIMKEHSIRGGEIIKNTFGHLDDEEYEKMAFEVAMYHHEKWNGKGYPKGLKGDEIPLSARIMAVADVFDAVSAKRVYRDAMPLEKCFEIIEKGKGSDFDDTVVEAFFSVRDKVENIYKNLQSLG